MVYAYSFSCPAFTADHAAELLASSPLRFHRLVRLQGCVSTARSSLLWVSASSSLHKLCEGRQAPWRDLRLCISRLTIIDLLSPAIDIAADVLWASLLLQRHIMTWSPFENHVGLSDDFANMGRHCPEIIRLTSSPRFLHLDLARMTFIWSGH